MSQGDEQRRRLRTGDAEGQDVEREETIDRCVRKFQKELNAGTVALTLLAHLEAADEPLYGYQIARRLDRDASEPLPMKAGTLYPVLRSLEKLGLLESRMLPSDAGPDRRGYEVTELGRSVLPQLVESWRTTRDFVDRAAQRWLRDPGGGRER